MNNPFYITGYERSGTTLLRRIMSMHPSLEADIVHEQSGKLMKASNKKSAIECLTYSNKGLNHSILSGQKIPYISFEEMKRNLNKFSNLFPEVFVIHIVRDPVYAINSQVSTFNRKPDKCIKTYFESVPKSYEHLSLLKNSTVISYDSLTNNPIDSISTLYEWMGKEIDENYIEKVISNADSWEYGGRLMCGLRYHNSISCNPSELILEKEIVKKIEDKKKEYNYLWSL